MDAQQLTNRERLAMSGHEAQDAKMNSLSRRIDATTVAIAAQAALIEGVALNEKANELDLKNQAQRLTEAESVLAHLDHNVGALAEDVDGLHDLVKEQMVGSTALMALVGRLEVAVGVIEGVRPLALLADDLQVTSDKMSDLARRRAEIEGQLLELRLDRHHLTRRIDTETAFAKAEAPQDGKNAEIRKQQMDMYLAGNQVLTELGERAESLDEAIIRAEFETSQLAQEAKMLETRLRAQQSQVVAYSSLARVISTHLVDIEEVA